MEQEITLFDQPAYRLNQEDTEKASVRKKGKWCKKVVATVGSGVMLGTFVSWASDSLSAQDERASAPLTDVDDLDDSLVHNTGAVYEEDLSTGEAEFDSEAIAEVADVVAEGEVAEDVDEVSLASNGSDSGISMSLNVTDDMSFDKAFSVARAEVGAGGAFEWRENLYATYTEEEWNSMDDFERDSFVNQFNWNSDSFSDNDYAEAVSNDEVQELDDVAVNAETMDETNSDDVAALNKESDVEVLGVLQEDDTITVDGQDVYLVDVDSDLIMEDNQHLSYLDAEDNNWDYTDGISEGEMDNFDMP